MDRHLATFMGYGKTVISAYTGEIYKIVDENNWIGSKNDDETLKCVSLENCSKYMLLKERKQNMVYETESCWCAEDEQELKGYEVELRIEDIEPGNMVRFITPNYQTKFEAKDLSNVKVNGKIKRVVFLDEHHFSFLDKAGVSDIYHIYQFAEICEENGIVVEPVKDNFTRIRRGK